MSTWIGEVAAGLDVSCSQQTLGGRPLLCAPPEPPFPWLPPPRAVVASEVAGAPGPLLVPPAETPARLAQRRAPASGAARPAAERPRLSKSPSGGSRLGAPHVRAHTARGTAGASLDPERRASA